MMVWQEYVPHAMYASAAFGTSVAAIFKDSIREAWSLRKRRVEAELREREVERGRGTNLENRLLQILEADLTRNGKLLEGLSLTMSDFRDLARKQSEISQEMLGIAKETRESQRWIERQFRGPNT